MNSFTFLPSYFEAIKDLPEEQKNRLIAAICEYGVVGKEPKFEGMEKSIFVLIKPIIDSDLNYRSAQRDNGRKGGAPKGNKNATKKQPKNNLKTTSKQLKTTSKQLKTTSDKNTVEKTTQKQPTKTTQTTQNKHENENENDIINAKALKSKLLLQSRTSPPKFSEIGFYLYNFNRLFSKNHRVTDKLTRHLGARLKSFTLSQILASLVVMANSEFHRGTNDRGWVADPEFHLRSDDQVDKFCQADDFDKVLATVETQLEEKKQQFLSGTKKESR